MEFITKRAFSGKAKGEARFLRAVAFAAAGFFVSRACFMGELFPAGAALLAVAVSYDVLYIYLLPFMLLGLGTFYSSGIPTLSAAGAICGCGLVFFCTSKITFRGWHKCVIAGCVAILSGSIFHLTAGDAYWTSLEQLLAEGALTAAICGIFETLIQVKRKTKAYSIEAGLFCVCAAAMVIAEGVGVSWLSFFCAGFIVLFTGCRLGIRDGLLAAFACGLVISFCGGKSDGILLLSAGALAAGFVRGYGKMASALFGAAAMAAAGLSGFLPGVPVPYYVPAAAAACLIFLPARWMVRIDAALSGFIGAESSEAKKEASETAVYLKSVRKNFDDLSALFACQENKRVLLSWEFRAMSQILSHTIDRVCGRKREETARYDVEPAGTGYARCRSISGDSYLWEELPDGNFAVVLSDGMGKGKKAAEESGLTVASVIRLLKAGLEVELVLKLLNSALLLNAENESFSTMDLGIFNRKTGKMRFYKTGAAATFIKRKNRVETLRVSAMPMGIIDGLKIEYVSVSLNPGDQVIMISDGITDSKREDLEMNWLIEAISQIRSRDPQTMCDLIMNRAVENYGLREKDDLTVLAVRIV